MKKYIYYLMPLLALIFVFNIKFDSLAFGESFTVNSSNSSRNFSIKYTNENYSSDVVASLYLGGYSSTYNSFSRTSILILCTTPDNSNFTRVYSYWDPNSNSYKTAYANYQNIIVDGHRYYYLLFDDGSSNRNFDSLNYSGDFKFVESSTGVFPSDYATTQLNQLLDYVLNPPVADLGQLNYSVVDLVGERQSISLQFNGTSTGLENGDFDVEYAIMDNSYAYDTSFNAITGQITGRSFFDWSSGNYSRSDPDIGDWFLSGFLVSPNWSSINTDEVTVTDTLIPALTKNYYHKLSDPVNIGSPDIYAFSYPGNISDHMDSYQYRNQLTGYNYMPSYSIYVRPVKDNNVGQWSVVQWFMNQNNEAVVSKTTPSQNSNNMPTNNSVQTITQNGDTYNIVNNTYPDGTTDYPVLDPIFNSPEIPFSPDLKPDNILDWISDFKDVFNDILDFLGSFFDLFLPLLSWLPEWVINIIRFALVCLSAFIVVKVVKLIV